MGKILIKNGKIWDGERFYFADILTDNARIIKIAKRIDENADFVFDARDKIVSAGLVDIHTHMLGAFGINADLSCIPFGVTVAADASAVPDRKEKYDSFLVKNRVFVCAEFENNKAKLDNTIKHLEYYGEKAVGIKVYFDVNISDIKDIKPLKEVCDYAKNNNLIVMVHSSNSPVKMSTIISVLNKGDILTHAYHGGVNNASEDEYECIKQAKNRGVVIDAGLAGHIHTDFKIFKDAIKCGAIPDVISTDITKFSAYKRGGRYGMTMCMSIAKKLGMSEEDIFRAVTSTPAKVLGKESECGYLKVGRCADISVFEYANEGFSLTDNNGNTVSDEKGYRCNLCIAEGELVYKR